MSRFARSYVQTLLLHPGGTRKVLLPDINSEELQMVAHHVVTNLLSRADQESLVLMALSNKTYRREEGANANKTPMKPRTKHPEARRTVDDGEPERNLAPLEQGLASPARLPDSLS